MTDLDVIKYMSFRILWENSVTTNNMVIILDSSDRTIYKWLILPHGELPL